MGKIRFAIAFAIVALGMQAATAQNQGSDNLYQLFRNPPAEAKAFVRWWWNGNRVNQTEVLRELDLLDMAGFGGVEINPIAMPPVSFEPTQEALEWLSPEWTQVLKTACLGAKERGMIADLLVGSGWPFGGKFLKPDQTIERMAVNYKLVEGSQILRLKTKDLKDDLPKEYLRDRLEKESERTLSFVRLVPVDIKNASQIVDLLALSDGKSIEYNVPKGDFRMVWGVKQKGYREVVYGTLGADGPTMNHFDAEVTLAFLNRLKEIEQELGIPLAELVRALFCDSMELAGSNWCQDFPVEFFKRCGYSLDPFYPFIFNYYDEPYSYAIENKDFEDQVLKVRYDYNRVLVDLFHERFTKVFRRFCSDNQLLLRFQAYGNPWLIGILDGYMLADIPESNNWFYVQNSFPDTADHFTWVKDHGSLIWNKYAASGAHLTGNDVVSCEAMTNLGGVFKASLSSIKQADDMNFITGITHSVLHGFNYSPPEAAFPGWIRYGTFFSEHNTLWPHFTNWLRYNSRVSTVLQNSDPIVQIAILGPEADTWSSDGLRRVPFQTEPNYVYDLWEGISQNGSSCDYINERVIQGARMKKGKMQYGPMAYETLVLADVKSLTLETAQAVERFVSRGGKLIIVGQEPIRSVSMSNSGTDEDIIRVIQKVKSHSDRVFIVEAPQNGVPITQWVADLFNETGFEPDIGIEHPDRSLYQIHHRSEDSEIFFITNTNRKRSIKTDAKINLKGKTVWRWNPENGEREQIATYNNSIAISLQPLQSMILFIEEGSEQEQKINHLKPRAEINPMELEVSWQATFYPKVGDEFTKSFTELVDFKESNDSLLANFAGDVVYKASFETLETNFDFLDLGNVNDGVTRVSLNGMSLGSKWYGKHVYDLDTQMRMGPNTIEIEYTSLLWNYCRSLDIIETNRWIRNRDLISNGIMGPIILGLEE